jgi:DnaJ-class molecular chaperone
MTQHDPRRSQGQRIMTERRIICPECRGSKFAPSAATTARNWCEFCEGQGWFVGRPQRLATAEEYLAAMRAQPLSGNPNDD